MGDIRVYEAARRLNIETKELMKILANMGKKAKSPIAFMKKEDFDAVLDHLTKQTGETAEAPAMETPEAPAEPESPGEAAEAEKSRIFLVGGAGRIKENDSAAQVIPIARFADEEEEAGEEKTASDKAEREVQERGGAPEAIPGKTGTAQSILSFLALGVASAALLVALTLNSGITKNTESLGKAIDAVGVMKSQVKSLEDGVRLNKNMIVENSGSISDARSRIEATERARARADLMKSSETIGEMSSTAPGNIGSRLERFSEGLRSLASSI